MLVNSLGWIPVVWPEPKDFPHCRLRTGLILVQEHRVAKLSGFTPVAMAPLSSHERWFAELGSKQSNRDLVDTRGMVGTYSHAMPFSVFSWVFYLTASVQAYPCIPNTRVVCV